MATRMLLNNGHQRIGYLSSSHGIEDDAMRKAGWMSALKEQDIIPPEAGLALARRTCRAVRRRWLNCWGAIYNLPLYLLITTIYAGALTALKDNGIAIPLHLSIIGFDDIPIARYTDPQLTTVRYPIASMAKLATELALQGRQAILIRVPATVLCRRWCVAILSQRARMRRRSLTQQIRRCNRFQSVSDFTVS